MRDYSFQLTPPSSWSFEGIAWWSREIYPPRRTPTRDSEVGALGQDFRPILVGTPASISAGWKERAKGRSWTRGGVHGQEKGRLRTRAGKKKRAGGKKIRRISRRSRPVRLVLDLKPTVCPLSFSSIFTPLGPPSARPRRPSLRRCRLIVAQTLYQRTFSILHRGRCLLPLPVVPRPLQIYYLTEW